MNEDHRKWVSPVCGFLNKWNEMKSSYAFLVFHGRLSVSLKIVLGVTVHASPTSCETGVVPFSAAGQLEQRAAVAGLSPEQHSGGRRQGAYRTEPYRLPYWLPSAGPGLTAALGPAGRLPSPSVYWLNLTYRRGCTLLKYRR